MKESKFRYMSLGDKIFTLVVYIFLSIILVIILYPLIYVIAASFSDPQAVISGGWFCGQWSRRSEVIKPCSRTITF